LPGAAAATVHPFVGPLFVGTPYRMRPMGLHPGGPLNRVTLRTTIWGTIGPVHL